MTPESLTPNPLSNTPALVTPSVEGNDVLNVKEAARLLRISPDKLTRLARRGEVPHGVLGGRYRFSRQALLASLALVGRQGPIKPVRKLADFPPAKLLARVQKLGGNLALVKGRIVLEGLKREEIGQKLWAALEKNHAKLVQELQRQQAEETKETAS